MNADGEGHPARAITDVGARLYPTAPGPPFAERARTNVTTYPLSSEQCAYLNALADTGNTALYQAVLRGILYGKTAKLHGASFQVGDGFVTVTMPVVAEG